MRLDDRPDQPGKAGFDFLATRRVVHLDASALALNQTGFPEGLEVLGQG